MYYLIKDNDDLLKLTPLFMIGVVHEHPRIGSDGESEEGSGTSEDPNVSPTSDEIAINNGKQVDIFFLPTL